MKIIMIVVGTLLALFIGISLYAVVENVLKRRKYQAKYQVILQHVLGMDFGMYETCNIFANEEELIFVSEEKEQRIPASQLERIEFYTEHDMKGRAARELVKISSLEGIVRNVPRGNEKKDLYVLVINYAPRPDDIQVIGFVGDNPMNVLESFTKGTNRMYKLVTMIEETGLSLEPPPED